MNLKALVECIHELQQDSEAQSTFRSVFSTRLTPTLLRGLGLRASPRRRGGCPELEFDTQMPKGLLGEGKAQALLAKAGGEETVYARPKLPKLDRAPAGVRPFTRSEALAALGGGGAYTYKSVGGGLYAKVTRAILAEVDKPPEPTPEEKRKRAQRRRNHLSRENAAATARSVADAKKKATEAVTRAHNQATRERQKQEVEAIAERHVQKAIAKSKKRVNLLMQRGKKLAKLKSMGSAQKKKAKARKKK